jgi:thiosulfate dehydrogenase [quinone] large subunit
MSGFTLQPTSRWLQRQLKSEAAILLPLRLFIGIGWIRAGLEKLIDPGWPAGFALAQFFHEQMASGTVVFPFYQHLLRDVFVPHALGLSWLIMIGQLLTGIAIMTGTFTNLALMAGLFMNLNFILAGRVTPSAFYIVIQIVLLVGNAGYVLGVDQFLAKRIPVGLLVAQPYATRGYARMERRLFMILALLAPLFGLASMPYIQDYGPHSVDDPAMIMLVLSIISGFTALITYFKFPRPERREVVIRDRSREVTRPVRRAVR